MVPKNMILVVSISSGTYNIKTAGLLSAFNSAAVGCMPCWSVGPVSEVSAKGE
jgi:hypothetical protein